MTIPFLYDIVLYSLVKQRGERTVYSIYHLLNGKKSSQTIQDTHLFQLGKFFGTYKIDRGEFDKVVQDLIKEKYLSEASETHFEVTEKGLLRADAFIRQHPFLQDLDGWKFQGADAFWERLSLIIQVVSNLTHDENKYIPVQKNKGVQAWVKVFLVKNRYNREDLALVLYTELIHCLKGNEKIDPSVIVIRLTGFHSIGLTENQASEALQIEPTLYHYYFLSFLHYIIRIIETDGEKYSVLEYVLVNIHQTISLTVSTRNTFMLLKKGHSMEEIARMRKLKLGTIQDHVVELALNMEDFEITPYVDAKRLELIIAAVKNTSSKQLKRIRQIVPEASYFEIRLVIAKFGDEK